MKSRFLITAILLGCCNFHGMEQDEAKKHKEEFEKMLEAAQKLHTWAAEARVLRNNPDAKDAAQAEFARILAAEQARYPQQSVANPKPTSPIKFARIAPQVVQIRNMNDDNDNDPFTQFLAGKRNDLDVILTGNKKEEKES